MRAFLGTALLLSACCCPLDLRGAEESENETPTATAYDASYVSTHLARLRQEAGCDGTPTTARIGVFCAAARGFATGTAAPLPQDVARVGLTTWVPTQGSVAAADAQHGRFSVLAFARNRAAITSPNATSNDPAVATAMSGVESNLRGTRGPIMLTGALHTFVGMQALGAEYPVARTERGWQISGGSYADLVRVGDTWVAVEVPRNNPQGLYFSVFVDDPYQRIGL